MIFFYVCNRYRIYFRDNYLSPGESTASRNVFNNLKRLVQHIKYMK